MIFTIAISLLFLITIFMIFFEEIFSQIKIVGNNFSSIILGLIIVILFLFAIFFIILRIIELGILLLKKTPAIIITDKYIIDNSRYYGFGKIPWNKIKYLNLVTTSSGKKYIELHLDNEFYSSIKLNTLKRILLWFDHYGNKSIVYLRNTFTDCNMEEISATYNVYKKKRNFVKGMYSDCCSTH
ncbi:STM3941 family protein [Empedobacter brevis]